MKIFDQKTEWKFKEFCNNHPYIIKAQKTLGGWDLILFIVSDTLENFHTTIKDLKNLFSDSIKHYETWVAYKEHYFQNFPGVIINDVKK